MKMSKKILSVVLALLMLISGTTVLANAENILTAYSSGATLYLEEDDTKLVVAGGSVVVGADELEAMAESLKKIESIYIAEDVTFVSPILLMGCFNLNWIDVAENNPSYKSVKGVLFNKDGTEIIRYPAAYLDNDMVSDRAYVIPETVTKIGEYAFSYCLNLRTVKIPQGVTDIGNFAFYNCVLLSDVDIPENLISLGEYAFSECMSLQNAVIPATVNVLGEDAFSGCLILRNLEMKSACFNGFTNSLDFGFKTIENFDIEFYKECCVDYAKKNLGIIECTEEQIIEAMMAVMSMFDIDFEDDNPETTIKYDATIKAHYNGELTAAIAANPGMTYEVYKNHTLGAYRIYGDEIKEVECSACGVIGSDATHEHNLGINVTSVAASCTTEKYQSETCNECGLMFKYNIEPALGHKGGTASCRACAVCDDCGEEYGVYNSENHINIITDTAIPATCTSVGSTEGKHCDDCGKIIVARQATSKLSHTYVVESQKTVTCTEMGYTIYVCTSCRNRVVGNHIQPTNAHLYNENRVCVMCGFDLKVNCTCGCHQTGIENIIYKILIFFQKIFGMNQICTCGKVHY